ncbi:hypothetical protein [Candidatus Halobonum tyrrellensis]|uniref:Uncharacterized protein n=1 Tax=Candidatus Halobonum tyrrellensis G22 TaxID=1324957 RepID=V4HFE4_9EURY|nr:hypothetical protein [Candidatus Halobonum tyrrellensis]ESP89405.1 hypothetical protein K933_04216 [Candidatus Halobonum tyrrellensis G22]
MRVRQSVPEQLLTPISLVSLGVTVTGAVLGYIFLMLAFTLYLGLNGLPLTDTQSLLVAGTGVACLAAGYGGWRAFLAFAK